MREKAHTNQGKEEPLGGRLPGGGRLLDRVASHVATGRTQVAEQAARGKRRAKEETFTAGTVKATTCRRKREKDECPGLGGDKGHGLFKPVPSKHEELPTERSQTRERKNLEDPKGSRLQRRTLTSPPKNI